MAWSIHRTRPCSALPPRGVHPVPARSQSAVAHQAAPQPGSGHPSSSHLAARIRRSLPASDHGIGLSTRLDMSGLRAIPSWYHKRPALERRNLPRGRSLPEARWACGAGQLRGMPRVEMHSWLVLVAFSRLSLSFSSDPIAEDLVNGGIVRRSYFINNGLSLQELSAEMHGAHRWRLVAPVQPVTRVRPSCGWWTWTPHRF